MYVVSISHVLIVALGLWICPMIIGGIYANKRSRSWVLGFGLSFFLGWVGFLLFVLLNPKKSVA